MAGAPATGGGRGAEHPGARRQQASRISVSAISTNRFSLEEDLEFWAASGIGRVGVSLRKLEAAGLERGARLVLAAGLEVTNLLGLGFPLTERSRWPAHQDRLQHAVAAAAEMRAKCLVLTTGPAGAWSWEEAAEALEEALGPVLADARRQGVACALEHTNSLRVDVSFLHTLRDAVDLAERLGTGVCVECNACWAERGLAGTITRGIERFRLVQVSDYVVGTLSTPDRAVPGDGHIPLGRLLGQIAGAGYDGDFDLELIGPRIESEGYASAVRRSVDALEALLAGLGL